MSRLQERLGMLWLPALVVVALAILGEPLLNPDGLEMSEVGRSLLGGGGGSDRWDLLYYPPLFPLLGGALRGLFGVGALVLPALLAAGLLVLPLAWFARALSRDSAAGVLVALTLISLAPVRFYGLLGEPRMVAALGIFAAWALLVAHLRRRESRQGMVWIGVLAGAVALTRPEGVVLGPLLVLFALWRSRASGLRLAAGFSVVALPWLAALSAAASRPTISSRTWELAGVPLLSFLPVRPVVQLWGVGADSRPLRELLAKLGPGEFRGESGPLDSLAALVGDLFSLLPLPLMLFAIVGVVASFATLRRGTAPTEGPAPLHLLIALAAAVAPAVAVTMTPVGRDVAMPFNNTIPVVLALVIFAAVGLSRVATAVESHRATRRAVRGRGLQLRLALLLPLLVCGALKPYPANPLFLPQSSDAGLAAAGWIAEQLDEGAAVASTFASSPVVHLSEHPWEPLPSRWDGAVWEAPDHLLITAVDGAWPLNSPLLAEGERLEPVSLFVDDLGWALVLRRVASAR